ncbi:MAG TPA: type II secretion system F family protein [Candidatus Bathyarchaeia archaeon]|nr:type II secretion system F family protein [Candidatus Bathyarchaeia archaeon]
MPTYKYVAKNHEARSVMGNITVDNQSAVVKELRDRGLMVVSITEVKEAGQKVGFFGRKKKVKQEDIVIFSRQLATMIEAGIPILQALEALEEQMETPYFKEVISSMREDIQQGNSLSTAFAKHPRVFDNLYVNMIKVGETGGILNTILERVAGYLEKSLRLKRQIKSALTYPTVVVLMAGVITTVLLVKVVPAFAEIYESFDAELPALTKSLINLSEFLKQNLFLFIGSLILAGFFLVRWYRTKKGRLAVDGFTLRMPIFGPLLQKVALSRFSRTLSILLQSGVPILESLDIVGKSSGNAVVELVIAEVKNTVKEGESIAAPLMKSPVFPPMVTRMIAIGEKSGQLEKMLNKIAEFYDDQVDAAVAGLTSIIEPLIIGVLGVVIGFIVIALFMPILQISQLVG